MAPKLFAHTQKAAVRRFVVWCAINLRPQGIRKDDGYKLHAGILCPGYVETTLSENTFNKILADLHCEVTAEVKRKLRLHRESCLKLGYVRPFLGARLDLTTVGSDEYITFSVSYVAEGATEITRVGLATRAFPGAHTAGDIEPWIAQASVKLNI